MPYIIVSKNGNFFDGKNWVTEYSDALAFKYEDDAMEVIRFARINNWLFLGCSVIEDYGLETEKVIYRVPT